MKKIIIAMAAIAAAFTVASCNKELVNPNENPTVGKSVITASIENDATKTALTPDEEGYKVVWKEGDKIYVGDINEEMWSAEYTLDSSSADSSKGTFGWQDGDFFCPENDIYTKPTFEKGEEYEAIYPFSLFNMDDNGGYAGGNTWKTEQTYSTTDLNGNYYTKVGNEWKKVGSDGSDVWFTNEKYAYGVTEQAFDVTEIHRLRSSGGNIPEGKYLTVLAYSDNGQYIYEIPKTKQIGNPYVKNTTEMVRIDTFTGEITWFKYAGAWSSFYYYHVWTLLSGGSAGSFNFKAITCGGYLIGQITGSTVAITLNDANNGIKGSIDYDTNIITTRDGLDDESVPYQNRAAVVIKAENARYIGKESNPLSLDLKSGELRFQSGSTTPASMGADMWIKSSGNLKITQVNATGVLHIGGDGKTIIDLLNSPTGPVNLKVIFFDGTGALSINNPSGDIEVEVKTGVGLEAVRVEHIYTEKNVKIIAEDMDLEGSATLATPNIIAGQNLYIAAKSAGTEEHPLVLWLKANTFNGHIEAENAYLDFIVPDGSSASIGRADNFFRVDVSGIFSIRNLRSSDFTAYLEADHTYTLEFRNAGDISGAVRMTDGDLTINTSGHLGSESGEFEVDSSRKVRINSRYNAYIKAKSKIGTKFIANLPDDADLYLYTVWGSGTSVSSDHEGNRKVNLFYGGTDLVVQSENGITEFEITQVDGSYDSKSYVPPYLYLKSYTPLAVIDGITAKGWVYIQTDNTSVGTKTSPLEISLPENQFISVESLTGNDIFLKFKDRGRIGYIRTDGTVGLYFENGEDGVITNIPVLKIPNKLYLAGEEIDAPHLFRGKTGIYASKFFTNADTIGEPEPGSGLSDGKLTISADYILLGGRDEWSKEAKIYADISPYISPQSPAGTTKDTVNIIRAILDENFNMIDSSASTMITGRLTGSAVSKLNIFTGSPQIGETASPLILDLCSGAVVNFYNFMHSFDDPQYYIDVLKPTELKFYSAKIDPDNKKMIHVGGKYQHT